MEKDNKQEIVAEFGSGPDDPLHKVVRSFYLRVRHGPLEAMMPGQLVRLTPAMAKETFLSGKTEPHEVGESFECIQPTRVVGENKDWLDVKIGDEVSLSNKQEAIELLRRMIIREIRK